MLRLFPSPQGGSETCLTTFAPKEFSLVSIPSRRVGDSTFATAPICARPVSIPSRRVGDFRRDDFQAVHDGFPSPQGGSETAFLALLNLFVPGFHPLKAGRRLLKSYSASPRTSCFHPLKAGRRPRGNEGKGGQKKAKGREGCRRPSVGGKS